MVARVVICRKTKRYRENIKHSVAAMVLLYQLYPCFLSRGSVLATPGAAQNLQGAHLLCCAKRLSSHITLLSGSKEQRVASANIDKCELGITIQLLTTSPLRIGNFTILQSKTNKPSRSKSCSNCFLCAALISNTARTFARRLILCVIPSESLLLPDAPAVSHKWNKITENVGLFPRQVRLQLQNRKNHWPCWKTCPCLSALAGEYVLPDNLSTKKGN